MKSSTSLKILLFGLVAGLLVSGCATTRPVPPAGKEPASLKDICAKYNVQWVPDSVSQVVTLHYRERTAKILIDSNTVVIDDRNVSLSEPVRMRYGVLTVPADFKGKIIDELTKKIDHTIRKFREIVIDAGHGGKDPGAIGRRGVKEKEVVIDIAKKLRELLEAAGIKVTMTRTADEFISLEERTRVASRSSADLFISIHANSSRSRGARGFEVYYLRDTDYLKKRDDVLEKNFQAKEEHLSMKKSDQNLEAILMDMMLQHKKVESQHLADHVCELAPSRISVKNRGFKSAGFFVLRNTLIPAILVEVGFLTNSHEEFLLKNSAYRQKVAEGLAHSLLDYANEPLEN